MKKVMVFGAGLIGGFMADQLRHKYDVTVCDGDYARLKPLQKNVSALMKVFKDDSEIEDSIKYADPDIIVNAFPGHLGFKVLNAAINCQVNIVDIAFMPENPLDISAKAKGQGVTAVVDFGFAPGMSHMFVGRANHLLAKHDSSTIWVGGLQLHREDYKAVFSPIDVIEEYTRPARYLRNKQIKTEDPFHKRYPYDDCLTGFISDGLRTLVGMDVPNIVEYTLRSNSHFDYIKQLKKDGFFHKDQLKNTASILIDAWKMTDKDHDYSLLDVKSSGLNADGKQIDILHYMYDEYDTDTSTHSMARATGLPAVAMVEAILEGKYTKKGIIPPEWVAKNTDVYNFICDFLRERGIHITERYSECDKKA